MFYLLIVVISLFVFLLTKKIIEKEVKYRDEISKESNSEKRQEFLQARKKWFLIRFLVGFFILLPVLSVALLTLIKYIV